jgi:hypothetical protein
MGYTFFSGEIPVIYSVLKYLFVMVFLVSAVGKGFNFNNTVNYYMGITNLSSTFLIILLGLLILIEMAISVFVWIEDVESKPLFISIMILLGLFLTTNIFFLFRGTDNCGCFGAGIQSHPTIGIIKTTSLILIWIYLRKKSTPPINEDRSKLTS